MKIVVKKFTAFLMAMLVVFTTLPLYSIVSGVVDETVEEDQIPASDKVRYIVLLLDIEAGFNIKHEGKTIYKVRSPINEMKAAAKEFVNLMSQDEGTNYIAIVKYGSSTALHCGFISTKTEEGVNSLHKYIDSLSVYSAGFADINDAYVEAERQLENNVIDKTATKNIVLFTQGINGRGEYISKNGKYTEDDCDKVAKWGSNSRCFYEYSNATYATARDLMNNGYNLYTIGLFQKFKDVPEEGYSLLSFAKRFSRDLQNSGYQEIENPEDLKIAFNKTARDIKISPIDFKFAGAIDENNDLTASCYYSDHYFAMDATQYDEHLATMSLCLELTSWPTHSSNAKWDNEIEKGNIHKYQNAKDLLIGSEPNEKGEKEYPGLGYTNFAVNDCWDTAPTKDSIGVITAKKRCFYSEENPDEGYTIIPIVIRGGEYQQEWAGNFALGAEGEHEGFASARDKVITFIDNYIKNNTDASDTKIKLWIVGFSRGGAVANMVAGYFVDNDGKIGGVTVQKEDIYAYTFEAPQGAYDINTEEGIYSNIHNIINVYDLVPYVAPDVWGFSRYNKYSVTLPTIDEPGYQTQKNSMLKFYNKFLSMINDDELRKENAYNVQESLTVFKPQINTSFITNSGSPSMEFQLYANQPTKDILYNGVSYLALDVFKNRLTYYENYQTAIQEILILAKDGGLDDLASMGISSEEFVEIIISKLPQEKIVSLIAPLFVANGNSETLLDQMYAELEKIIKDILSDETVWGAVQFAPEVVSAVTKLLGSIILAIAEDIIEQDTYSISDAAALIALLIQTSAFQSHSPEVTLSWLMSLDSYYCSGQVITRNVAYRALHFNCPIDVRVYDKSTNTLVAAIIDNVVQDIDNLDTGVTAYINLDDEKVVNIPSVGDFSVELTATGDGTVDYTINEIDSNSEKNVRIVSYQGVEIKSGNVLVADVPALSPLENDEGIPDGSSAKYSLQNTDQTVIEPSEELLGEDAENATYNINVTGENNCVYVSGGGEYTYGTFAAVEAFIVPGSEFIGWYCNDELVSTDKYYRFAVTENMDLVAKASTVSFYDLSFESETGGTISNMDLSVPAETTVQLEAIADKGYVFDHWSSESGTFEDIYDPNTTYQTGDSNAIITAHWKLIIYAPGDVDGDGDVDTIDLTRLSRALAGGSVDMTSGADVNNDGSISTVDRSILQRTLNKGSIY